MDLVFVFECVWWDGGLYDELMVFMSCNCLFLVVGILVVVVVVFLIFGIMLLNRDVGLYIVLYYC